MKKTLGFFDASTMPGGTTRYLSILVSGLDRAEFDLVLFALQHYEWHREFERMGVEIVTLRPVNSAPAGPAGGHNTSPASKRKRRLIPPGVGWSLGLFRETLELKRLFGKRRVDLLHSNNAGAEPAPIAARLAGVPVVIATWHVDSTYDLENIRSGLRYRLLEIACMRSLHHAISVSHATARDWVRRCHLPPSYERRISVIHNGIDVERLRRRKSVKEAKADEGLSGRLVIGSMGRLEAAKGYEYLIRALPAVVKEHPETLVRIAGRGELEESLTTLARELGVERHLEFCGFVTDIRTFLEPVDIYLQPSLCEAFGLAAVEAAAVGMPVVASAVGGLAEVLNDRQTGLSVPVRDSETLSKAVGQLAADVALRRQMASAGCAWAAAHFGRQEMVARTMAVYRKLLSGSLY